MDDKKKKIRAVIFIVIEIVAFLLVYVPALVSTIEYDGVCSDSYTILPPHYFGVEDRGLTTTFDHVITDFNGVEYPAGTVFKVESLTPGGCVYFDYVDEDGVSHPVTNILNSIDISEAENSDELQMIYDQFIDEFEAERQRELDAREPEFEKRREAYHKTRIKNSCHLVFLGVTVIGLTFVMNWFLRRRLFFQILYVPVLCVGIVEIFAFVVAQPKAPIIYLYPEEETVVNVQLELNGELGTTYPHYNEGGWTVTASPDGTLTGDNGREYSYLFWEGSLMMDPDLSQGFCVKGEDTAEFLEWALAELGLNDIEADAFIMYWLPQMEGNKYNVISFQTTAYEDAAALYVTPAPDTEIRVNMLWYSSLINVDIEAQDLASINPDTRDGFTVVEWGGEEYKAGLLQYFLR